MKKEGYRKGFFVIAPIWFKQDPHDPEGCDIVHRWGVVGWLLWWPSFAIQALNNAILSYTVEGYQPSWLIWHFHGE